jgi:hypothetical protein
MLHSVGGFLYFMTQTSDVAVLGMVAAGLAAATLAVGRGFDNFGTGSGLAADLEGLLGNVFEVAPFLALLILAGFVTRSVMFR